MQYKQQKWIIAALALAASLLALGTLTYRRAGYEVVHPRRGDISEAVYGLGKVKSSKRFEVVLGVLSSVTRRHVNEGQAVKKGAPLLEFDTHAVFRAPFDGVVTYESAYVGENVLPHVPVLRLEDLRDRYIEISLEQQSVLRIRDGMPAKVSFESLRGRVLGGTVTAVFPREDEFLVHIAVEGLEGNVLPGMTADVSIEVGKITDALLVPLKAVQNGQVTVRRDGRWRKLKVEVGHVDGESAEVRRGSLSPEDELRVRTGD